MFELRSMFSVVGLILVSLLLAVATAEEGVELQWPLKSAQSVFGKQTIQTAELQTALRFYNFSQQQPKRPNTRAAAYKDCGGNTLPALKEQWIESGWIILKPCSMKTAELDAAAKLTATANDRVVNAFTFDVNVRSLAVDPETLFVLKHLHGGVKPFPFQTLNFPKGTKQKIHNDLIHFSTYPQGMMAAAWIALEDIKADSGPLQFYPGSHKLGMQYYDELGVQREGSDDARYGDYEIKLAAYIQRKQLQIRVAPEMKKGEVLMWSAALLHGGSEVLNASRTRLSQVNHYYFEGAEHTWVPRMSPLEVGRVRMRDPCSSSDPTKYKKFRKDWLQGISPTEPTE